MNIIDQARRYLASIPPSVSGQEGHKSAFVAATALINGFALGYQDAFNLLSEWNRGCQPPWSDAELAHKIKSADSTPHDKPRGHLINSKSTRDSRPLSFAPKPEAKPEIRAGKYEFADECLIPEPIEDGTRKLLEVCFRPGDGVRIVPATLNDDGHEIPDGRGPCLTREEWMAKLNAKGGNPNKIFTSPDGTGIYIGINPLKVGGAADADVTSFRHALLEFDNRPMEEQWQLYTQSGLPIAAVISSGGKSLHAWVRVDARDLQDYKDRVKAIYDHFRDYNLDAKNKNPSRLSRLPGCVRFKKRQELIAINIGVDSFMSWLEREQAAGIGEEIELDSLATFDPSNDPDSLIGARWLCRGGSVLIVGQSGVGKSSMEMQLAITWALGLSAFGVTPARPLSSLVVQAENDKGDTAEMFQGVLAGMGIERDSDDYRQLKARLHIRRDSSHTGDAFLSSIRKLIDLYKPDLVWIDPILSFVGDDISKQVVIAKFFREGLASISDATGVAWMMMHHTGKPPSDPKAAQRFTKSDASYLGIGSSDLTNWARAVVTLKMARNGQFHLQFAKRGSRAGAKELDESTSPEHTVTLEQSKHGICWIQVAPTVEAPMDDDAGRGRPSKVDQLFALPTGLFLDKIGTEPLKQAELAAMLTDWASEQRLDISSSTARNAIARFVENGVLKKKDGRYLKV